MEVCPDNNSNLTATSGYRVKSRDIYDFHFLYPDCAQTSFAKYKINSDTSLTLVTNTNKDPWVVSMNTYYKVSNNWLVIPTPGTKPQFFSVNDGCGYSFNIFNKDITITRTESFITATCESQTLFTWYANDFFDKAIPTRLLFIIGGGGGYGGNGTGRPPTPITGRAGGHGAEWCGIVELKNDVPLIINVGSGGKNNSQTAKPNEPATSSIIIAGTTIIMAGSGGSGGTGTEPGVTGTVTYTTGNVRYWTLSEDYKNTDVYCTNVAQDQHGVNKKNKFAGGGGGKGGEASGTISYGSNGENGAIFLYGIYAEGD